MKKSNDDEHDETHEETRGGKCGQTHKKKKKKNPSRKKMCVNPRDKIREKHVTNHDNQHVHGTHDTTKLFKVEIGVTKG